MTAQNRVFFRAGLAAASILAALVFFAGSASAVAVRMAVMGDSLSNVAQVPGGAPNWVSQLNSAVPGALSFQNKAVGGATSTNIVNSQLPSVITLAKNNQIDLVTTIIAGNDITFMLLDLSNGVPVNPATVVSTYVANVKTVINSISSANPNVKQVFGSMLDFPAAPALAGFEPDVVAMVDNIITQANAQANAYALSQGIPVLDIFGYSQIMPTVSASHPFKLGGVNFTSAYLSDGFHPRPWVQGLVANAVSTAYNVQYGLNLPIISDQRIVQNSNLTPVGPTSYYDVSSFIIFPTPEPSSWLLAAAGGTLVMLARVRRVRANRI